MTARAGGFSKHGGWIVALLPAALALAAFAPVLGNELLMFDDDINIYNNPNLGQLTWSRLGWMFADGHYMPRYMPLGWLQLALTFEAGGMSAFAYHLFNYVLHAANGALLGLALWRGLGLAFSWLADGPRAVAAALAAVAWTLHPLRIEPVAWATGAHYLHATFWALCAVNLAWARLSREGAARRARLHGAWACCGLSMLVYPAALGLPFALLAFEAWLARRARAEFRWREHAPFGAIMLLGVAANLVVRIAVPGIFPPAAELREFGFVERLLQAAHSAGYYVWRPLFPGETTPVRNAIFGTDSFVLLGCISLAVWIAWALWLSISRSAGALAWTFAFLGVGASYFGLLESPFQTSDRYTYVTGLVWTAGLAFAMAPLVANRASARILAPLGVVWCGWLACSARASFAPWRDTDAFFRHVARQVENPEASGEFATRRAIFLARRGEFAEARRALVEIERSGGRVRPGASEAVQEQEEWIRSALVVPSAGVSLDAFASHNLALRDAKAGESRGAEKRFRWCLEIAPGYVDARVNYVFFLLGQERREEARQWALPLRSRPLPERTREGLASCGLEEFSK